MIKYHAILYKSLTLSFLFGFLFVLYSYAPSTHVQASAHPINNLVLYFECEKVFFSDCPDNYRIDEQAQIVNSNVIFLEVTGDFSLQNVKRIRFANAGEDYGEWREFTLIFPWKLTDGEGSKTVYDQIELYDGTIVNGFGQFTVDKTPPQVNFDISTKVISDKSYPYIVGKVNHDIDGRKDYDLDFECKIGYDQSFSQQFPWGLSFNEEIWRPCNSDTLELPFLLWGDRTAKESDDGITGKVLFQARDKIGNLSPVLQSSNFVVDVTPPEVYATAPNSVDLRGVVYVTGYDAHSALDKIRISNDYSETYSGEKEPSLSTGGGIEKPYEEVFHWTFDRDRTAWIQLVDSVGNVSHTTGVFLGVPSSGLSTPIQTISTALTGVVMPSVYPGVSVTPAPSSPLPLPSGTVTTTPSPTINHPNDPKYQEFVKQIAKLKEDNVNQQAKTENIVQAVNANKVKINENTSLIRQILVALNKYVSYLLWWKH